MPEAFDDRRWLLIIGFHQRHRLARYVGDGELPLNVRIQQCLGDGLIDF